MTTPAPKKAAPKAPTKPPVAATPTVVDPAPDPDPAPETEAPVDEVSAATEWTSAATVLNLPLAEPAPVAVAPIPEAAPVTAVIEAPVAVVADPEPLAIVPSINDAAAERLRVIEVAVTVRDTAGNKVDTDTLFSAPDAEGVVICLVRLIQHSTATAYDRPVATLLLPAGGRISVDGAQAIVSKIQAERA